MFGKKKQKTHSVFEIDDLFFFFKRHNCPVCNARMKRRFKPLKVVKKGDPDHWGYCTIGKGYHPYGDIAVNVPVFYCKNCGYTAREQELKQDKKQKKLN